ncbi:hypothetical protein Dip510_000409 [Elusimicrobium posterum]|uniref:hypothetical protein n=1 Tax=Elusimicrobium posterum TaxID=3116653 RepID=UPI003C72EA12
MKKIIAASMVMFLGLSYAAAQSFADTAAQAADSASNAKKKQVEAPKIVTEKKAQVQKEKTPADILADIKYSIRVGGYKEFTDIRKDFNTHFAKMQNAWDKLSAEQKKEAKNKEAYDYAVALRGQIAYLARTNGDIENRFNVLKEKAKAPIEGYPNTPYKERLFLAIEQELDSNENFAARSQSWDMVQDYKLEDYKRLLLAKYLNQYPDYEELRARAEALK